MLLRNTLRGVFYNYLLVLLLLLMLLIVCCDSNLTTYCGSQLVFFEKKK